MHSFMFNKLFPCVVFQSERLYLEVMLPTAWLISRYYSRISFQKAVLFRLLSRHIQIFFYVLYMDQDFYIRKECFLALAYQTWHMLLDRRMWFYYFVL